MPINLSKNELDDLSKQIYEELNNSYNYLNPVWQRYDEYWNVYLNDLNSFRKEEFKLKEFSTFSVVQNLLSILTQDTFNFDLRATDPNDVGSVDILEKIIRYDFFKTKRNAIDEEMVWNALFYGEANVLLHQYNKVRGRTRTTRDYYAPTPTVLDQRTFLYDPQSVRGQGKADGSGAYQYCGFLTATTRGQLERFKNYYTIDDNTFSKTNSALYTTISINNIVRGYQTRLQNQLVNGAPYNTAKSQPDYREIMQGTTLYAMNWLTFFKNKPVMVIFLGDIDNIIRYEELDFDELPIITRSLYPATVAKNPIGVPSLTIDKQRGVQTVMNLALENEVKKMNGLWLFDESKIKRNEQLVQPTGAFIPVDGPTNGSIERIPQGSTDSATDYILSSIVASEQRASGITTQQRGSFQRNTTSATEVDTASEASDEKAYAIRRRWREDVSEYIIQAIRIYDNLTSARLYNKVIRVGGLTDDEFINLSRRDISRVADVDVIVTDRLLQEREQVRDLPFVDRLYQQALTYERTDRRQLSKIIAEKMGFAKDEVDRIYPITASERLARAENQFLAQGRSVPIHISQDHNEHLQIHKYAEANEYTKQHIQRHIVALVAQEQLARLRAFEQQQQQPVNGQQQIQQPSQQQNLNNIAASNSVAGRLQPTQRESGGQIINSGVNQQV